MRHFFGELPRRAVNRGASFEVALSISVRLTNSLSRSAASLPSSWPWWQDEGEEMCEGPFDVEGGCHWPAVIFCVGRPGWISLTQLPQISVVASIIGFSSMLCFS
jgi:hypothetical protein